jgi:transposase InsO family protein
VADITYEVAKGEGFLYLAFILEVHSRRIDGWAMESHLGTELVVVVGAFVRMAVWRSPHRGWSTIRIRASGESPV